MSVLHPLKASFMTDVMSYTVPSSSTGPEMTRDVGFPEYPDIPTSAGREAVTVSVSPFQGNPLPRSTPGCLTNVPLVLT